MTEALLSPATLFEEDDRAAFAHQWEAIERGLLDSPKATLAAADALAAAVLQQLAANFAADRLLVERALGDGAGGALHDGLRRYAGVVSRLLVVA